MAIILCNTSDVLDEIENAKMGWIYEVLADIGIDEEVFDYSSRKFKHEMQDVGIDIEFMPNGGVDIYKLEWHEGQVDVGWLPATQDHLVGQWSPPERIKRIDGKKVYYEIHIKEWHFSGDTSE